MKAIIFGVNGQDGYYIGRICTSSGISVIGVSRSKGDWVEGDVSDKKFVRDLIEYHKPNYIFHFAANSSTRHSALYDNHNAIATGTINILEAVKDYCPLSKVFITGSGVQFKNNQLPINEKDEFVPVSPYAIARIYSAYAARYYRGLGIPVYVGYLFHHESPMRKGSHLSQIICDGVKKIAKGEQQFLTIGDTSVKKEWAFAGDIAKGIWHLMQQEKVFEATIGTGIAYSVEDWLQACFQMFDLDWKCFVKSPDTPFKPEYPILVSDNSTILSLGWKCEVDFNGLVNLMMK